MSTKDIYIPTDEMVQAIKAAEKSFKTFEKSYTQIKKVHSNLSNDAQFQGQGAEELLDIIDLLLQYHNDLIKYTPHLYKSIKKLCKETETIPTQNYFKGIKS